MKIKSDIFPKLNGLNGLNRQNRLTSFPRMPESTGVASGFVERFYDFESGQIYFFDNHLGGSPYTFHRGDRIAQMVIKKVYFARLEIVEALDETTRNTGGFGHTGK